MIEVSYALTECGEYALRRTVDADGTVTVERSDRPLEDGWTPYLEGDFDLPPVSEWETVESS